MRNTLQSILKNLGCKVFYPGLKKHNGYNLLKEIMNEGFGFGGMLAIDAGTTEKANEINGQNAA